MNYHFATIKKLIDKGYRFSTANSHRSEWRRLNGTGSVIVVAGGRVALYRGNGHPVWSYDFQTFIESDVVV